MIGYATIGTNDFERAKAFYDVVLKPLGGRRTLTMDTMQGYGGGAGAMLAVTIPYDEKPATPGNGVMIALLAPNKEVVDATYKVALESGATDDGAPGMRSDTFYGAYFRDLDGNKICVFKVVPAR